MSDVEQLLARVERAFRGVPHPDDDGLTDCTYGHEPEALRSSFSGKTDWRALDATFLNRALDGSGGALALFSDRAFRFYLPAYIVADIQGRLEHDFPASCLCAGVTAQDEGKRLAKAWGGGTMGERARRRFGLFDEEQRACVVAYLWWKLGVDACEALTIEQALETYWLTDP